MCCPAWPKGDLLRSNIATTFTLGSYFCLYKGFHEPHSKLPLICCFSFLLNSAMQDLTVSSILKYSVRSDFTYLDIYFLLLTI